MIFDGLQGVISPIVLSVLLIIYLMIIELGNEKIKKILIPIVIVFMALFSIVFIQNIASKW